MSGFRNGVYPSEENDPFWQIEERAKVTTGEIAHNFNVSEMVVSKAFSQLKKDRLIIKKGRVESFVA